MDTAAAFLRSIEANLADPAPILIYADWLEEQDRPDLAHAWRWMARRGYRPARRVVPGSHSHWAWWHTLSHEVESDPQDQRDLDRHPEARLPGLLFRAMRSSGAHVYRRTLAEAVECLAWGLVAVPELSGLESQPGDP